MEQVSSLLSYWRGFQNIIQLNSNHLFTISLYFQLDNDLPIMKHVEQRNYAKSRTLQHEEKMNDHDCK